MQAAALLYQITKQKSYLEDAQNIAEANTAPGALEQVFLDSFFCSHQ